jgi:glycosyltransferase involved in cell wall biosynthesis
MFVPKNTFVTVHDLIPLTAYWDGSKAKASFFRSLVSRAVRRAYRIIAVSETTESQLVTMFPRSKDKTVVIYESYEERLGRIASTLDERSVDGSYFLYVGNRKRHKNLGRVIEALSKIDGKNIKFVIAGQKDGAVPDEIETQVKDLNLGNSVLFFVNPSDEILASLYKGARFLIQPSLIEGFGLPPLEALSLGTPVLLSNIPIFREIYEGAAEYFDPLSVEDIAQKIVKWCDEDAERLFRAERVAHVLAKFNREKILDQYVALLRG